MKLFVTISLVLLFFSTCFCQSYQDTIFTNLFKRNNEGWNAGDGTISVGLPDGRTLWMFGDSHVDQGGDVVNNGIPCLFNARNCLMIQDSVNNFATYYDESGTDIYTRQFVKMEDETGVTYWPGGGIVYEDVLYTFWERYQINGPLDFQFLGMAIAEISLPNIELLSVSVLTNNTLEFGMAITSDATKDYHYIYGRRNEGIFRQAFVARCPFGQFSEDYEFYAGNNNWVIDDAEAVPILDDVSNSYSVFRCGAKYFLITQERGFLQCGEGREVYLYESATPEGPFENKTTIFTVEDQFDGDYPVTYNAQAHPQFTKNNELLISYNLNLTCPGPCAEAPFTSTFNADMYRPKFARVSLSTDCTISSQTNETQNSTLVIYPNPVDDFINIESPIFEAQQSHYEVYDLLGTLIMKGELKNEINVASLEEGIYILKICTERHEQIEFISKF